MTTATAGAALLRHILAEPDEDAHRLVYADWCEEQGDAARGEFIRVQCAVAAQKPGECAGGRCRYDDCPPPWCEIASLFDRRERELVDQHGRRWSVVPLPEDALRAGADELWGGGFTQKFRRGFVHALTATAADFLYHADALFAAQPVEEVTLTTRPNWQQPAWRQGLARLEGGKRLGRKWHLLPPGIAAAEAERRLLAAEFPRVKTWHLPQGEDFTTLNGILTQIADMTPAPEDTP